MTQANGLAMTIVTANFLLSYAAWGCFMAAFNGDDEFTIPCLLGSKHIDLRNVQGRTDFSWARYGHRFYSVCENEFHSTSPPHMGVPLVFPKNHKNQGFDREVSHKRRVADAM
jgi:hypothetical protein